jgi:hypothetical protein
MTIVVASLMFACLLSPPLGLLLLVGWLCGAHVLLLLPLGAWLVGTAWMTARATARHHLHRERFVDALIEAPRDVLEQLGRLVGVKRRRLRAIADLDPSVRLD